MGTHLRLSFDGAFKPREQEPPYLPDVFASRPIQVVGKWDGSLSGKILLQGYLAGGELWEYSVPLADADTVEVPAISLLWARARIAILDDYGAVGKKNATAIEEIGLEYAL